MFLISLWYNELADFLYGFRYDIPYNLVVKRINSSQGKIYLYDEILNRLMKCMCELEYCRKYSEGLIIITKFYIIINIMKQHERNKRLLHYKFELIVSGYPDIKIKDMKTYLGNPSKFIFNSGKSLKCGIIASKNKEEEFKIE